MITVITMTGGVRSLGLTSAYYPEQRSHSLGHIRSVGRASRGETSADALYFAT